MEKKSNSRKDGCSLTDKSKNTKDFTWPVLSDGNSASSATASLCRAATVSLCRPATASKDGCSRTDKSKNTKDSIWPVLADGNSASSATASLCRPATISSCRPATVSKDGCSLTDKSKNTKDFTWPVLADGNSASSATASLCRPATVSLCPPASLCQPATASSCRPSAAYCAGTEHDPAKIRQAISSKVRDDSEKNYPCLNLSSSSWRPGADSACLHVMGREAEKKNQIIAAGDTLTREKLDKHDEISNSFSASKQIKKYGDSVPGKVEEFPEDVDWERYRRFLFSVWEENSLSNSSLDSESSSFPSLSSISGEFPYALNILTTENIPSSRSSGSSTPEISEETPLESKSHELSAHWKGRSCIPPIVNCELESVLEKAPRLHPLANSMKESALIRSQGNTSINPAPLLRSQAQRQPLQYNKSSLSQPYKEGQFPGTYFRGSAYPQHQLQRREQPPLRHQEAKSFPKSCTAEERASKPTEKYTGRHYPYPRCDKSCANKAHAPDRSNYLVNRSESILRENRGSQGSEISQLQTEIELAQKRIMTLSQQMEEQSSHLQQLIGTRKRKARPEPFQEITTPEQDSRMTYPVLPQGYKAPHHGMYPPGMGAYGYGHPALSRRASCQYPCESPESPEGRLPSRLSEDFLMSHLAGTDPRELVDLRDRIVALQMQNMELNLFLKKEEQQRKEAEEAVKKEKEYVKKLQHSLQDLSTSTLVMDPLTYKQVADKYIASRKKAVRRTHTCNPSFLGSSDLVCDSKKLEVNQNQIQSTSCPSSPLGSNLDRKTAISVNHTTRTPPGERTYSRLRGGGRLRLQPMQNTNWEEGTDDSSSPLTPEDYNGLLHSIEGLQLSSSPS